MDLVEYGLYLVDQPPYYPYVMTGRYVRKTCVPRRFVRPLTRRDVAIWNTDFGPIEIPANGYFVDTPL